MAQSLKRLKNIGLRMIFLGRAKFYHLKVTTSNRMTRFYPEGHLCKWQDRI